MDPPSARPDAPRRARGRLGALALLTAFGAAGLAGCGAPATVKTVFAREAVNAPTPHPFTDPVGTDQEGVTPPENASGAYRGTIPGLYASNGDDPTCYGAALTQLLERDAGKAAAWAGVLGVAPDAIGAYVARLTSVVLRTDTAATSHGFSDGGPTTLPVVLQAGTAVLVDDRGAPVVKCGDGNPLTAAPPIDDAAYEGADWDDFSPHAVTTVTPADEPVRSLVVADPTGRGVRRPIGTNGPADTPYLPDEDQPASAPPRPSAIPTPADPGSDYPLDPAPSAATTYVATFVPVPAGPDYPGGVLTSDCERARFTDAPFSVTVRVRDAAVVGGEATVVDGGGPGGPPVALFSPTPTADLVDPISPVGTFSAGAERRYDGFYQGVLTARWSGLVGDPGSRPAELPLTIRQTWHRDRDAVAWLNGSGGPEDFACSFEVRALRQG